MASVYGFVRSIARVGAFTPSLRGMVGRRRLAPEGLDAQRNGFAALVESEIIPRLVLAHDAEPRHAGRVAEPIRPGDVDALARAAIEGSAATVVDEVGLFIDRGVGINDLFIHLLAPAARLLGTMWEEDRADFVAVTMALWRLQEAVHELTARIPSVMMAGLPCSALFSVMPGDQHSFGTVLIENVFRREGWQTELVTECDVSTLIGLISGKALDLVCLTVTADCDDEKLTMLINGMRSVARNADMCILVGGRAFGGDTARARAIGADGSAETATQALALAAKLVDMRMMQRNICA